MNQKVRGVEERAHGLIGIDVGDENFSVSDDERHHICPQPAGLDGLRWQGLPDFRQRDDGSSQVRLQLRQAIDRGLVHLRSLINHRRYHFLYLL